MDFVKYRPTTNSSAAVAASLALAQHDVAGVETRVAEAKRVRDEGLLTLAPREMRAAEDALASARGDAERLAAIVEQLGNRRVRLVEDEAVGKVVELARQRSDANAAMSNFARDHGEQLVELLEQGWALYQANQTLGFSIRRAQSDVFEHHPSRSAEVSIPPVGEPLSAEAERLTALYVEIGNIFSGTTLDQGGTEA